MPRPTRPEPILLLGLLLVLLGAGSGCVERGSLGSPADVLDANARVADVVDGDTIVVHLGDGAEERVRLVGIDTPESVDPSRPVMCFGKEASERLAQLLPEGTPVQLVRDVEPRDRYDRLLAYVYRSSDGLFVNLAMVTDGFADQLSYPPNTTHTDELRAAVHRARSLGTGLWSACDSPFEQ